MKNKLFLTLAVLMFAAASVFGQQTRKYDNGLEIYKLPNGLSVYLWEDKNASDVYGQVAFRAGSIDEPAEYTGLAHYLEHMLFKGTQKIGALDWEKEKPLYEKMIALYDQLNAETDEAKRLDLLKQINEVSMEEAKYSATNDFANLTESYGGTGLNAYTSYDVTAYHNYFPASAMEKWLELNSERLINPVFRSFQAELENVYEEFNMYEDNENSVRQTINAKHIYEGNAYGRSVIGTQEHLKNPSISKLIEFYNTWYVANNAALILVGNFDAETAKPLIAEKFGRLRSAELPARAEVLQSDYSGNPVKKEKIGYMPMYEWIYKGIKLGEKDEMILEFTTQLLNNGHNTGLLDRLMLDGELTQAYVMADMRRSDGRIWVVGVPYYDTQTRMFETKGQTHKLIFNEIEKIKDANKIPDWLFESVKNQQYQQLEVMYENYNVKANIAQDIFLNNRNPEYYIKMADAIKAITKEDVAACAKKYFAGNFLTIEWSEGEYKKNKLAKPAIKPLEYPKDVETAYSKEFKKIPTTPVEIAFNNFADVTERQLYKNVKMYYTPNTQNGVFSLTLKYGVGTHDMPKLEYAAQLMNMAGMMPNITAQEMRRRYSELGATYGFGVSDDYFYISLSGDEKNLDKILQLVSQHVMMPNLDDKQIRSMISGEYWGRYSEKRNPNIVSSALLQYVLYGEKSHFIDRIPMEELYKYSVNPDGSVTENFLVNKTNLTTTIQAATGYAVTAYYCGQRSIDEVAKSLNAIPMQEKMKDTESPRYHERQTYDKTNVLFLANSKMQQAKVYFYLNANPYKIQDEVLYDAFNQYFDGGFSGLVMNEIREKRSMAYTASGSLSTPGQFVGKDAYMFGFVGTQGDKVADAIDVFMSLLNDMPNHPERIDNIKNYLEQVYIAAKPGMRSKAAVYETWKRMGYTEDPAKMNLTALENLSYDDIKTFYEQSVKGKPVTIVIIGDPKTINQKQIKAKYGKIQKVSTSKLFKGGI